MTTKTVEFFFDIGSPYSYLAATQIEGLVHSAGGTVQWRPFLVGGVFKTLGHTPPVPQKMAFMVTDMKRSAAMLSVPFHMTSRFPLNTLNPQRALAAAGHIGGNEDIAKLAAGLFHGYWVDDQNVSELEVIATIAEKVELNGDAILGAASNQEVKDSLRATTEEAVARGAFGAPTCFVGDAMFWGHDRLDHLHAHLLTL